jgi:peptidoglycan L-alanyl-D-glutamate endopeptidase CwlK
MDDVSEKRLAKVHPKLAELVRAMADDLAGQGIEIRVVQGLRTWEEQKELYDQGRSNPGKIVTNALPGHSYHQFGLAVDVVPMTPQGPDWNDQNPVWKTIVLAGQARGLIAGAMWRSFPDLPHFQLAKIPASPTEYVRNAFLDHGIPGVWTALGLQPA